jgi:hypothetical protein
MPDLVPPVQCQPSFDPLSSQESREGRPVEAPLTLSGVAGSRAGAAASVSRHSELGQRAGDVLFESCDLGAVVERVELSDDVERRDHVVVGVVLGLR